MTRGTVTRFDANEKTGYVMPDDDDDEIPFDRESLVGFGPGEDPKQGDRVSFRVEGGMAGLWATDVKRID